MKKSSFVVALAAAVAVIGAVVGCNVGHPDATSDNASYAAATSDRCATPGQTRTCGVIVEQTSDYRSCAMGTQTCQPNEYWGACELPKQGDIEVQSLNLSSIAGGSGGGLSPLTVGVPTGETPQCANPCDSACVGWTSACGDAGTTACKVLSVDDAAMQYVNLPSAWKTAPVGTCGVDGLDNCGFGLACSSGKGCDDQWMPFEYGGGTCVAGAGPDLTLGFPCKSGSTPTFTICNRGRDPATSGNVQISVSDQPFAQPQSATQASPLGYCSFDLGANPLQPGQCKNFTPTSCTASVTFTGTRGLKVNDPPAGTTPLAECRTANNYVVYDPGTAPTCKPIACGSPNDTPDGGGCTASTSSNPSAVYGVPGAVPGFEDKLLDDPCHSPSGEACDAYDGTDVNHAWTMSACQADTYCDAQKLGGTGCCKRYMLGETITSHSGSNGQHPATCLDNKPDLTLAGACKLNDISVWGVCNRGVAAIPAGAKIAVVVDPSASVPPYTTKTPPETPGCWRSSTPGDCNITLQLPLEPGQCVVMNDGPGGNCTQPGIVNGNKTLYVNSDSAIDECTFDVKDSVSTLAKNQLGCANNITAFNENYLPACTMLYEPVTFKETYKATCPVGKRPQWAKIGWDATTPGLPPSLRSYIQFDARTRGAQYDGGMSAWSPSYTVGKAWLSPASAPEGYYEGPPSCPMDGTVSWGSCPASANGKCNCPKNMEKTLGATTLSPPNGGPPTTFGEELELTVTISPQGVLNVGMVAPTLRTWSVTYRCVDYE